MGFFLSLRAQLFFTFLINSDDYLCQGFGAVDFYSWLPAPRLPAPIAQNIAGSRLPGSGSRLPSKKRKGV